MEERAPNGCKELSEAITDQELEEIADEYKQVAGFDVDRVNNQPSLSVGTYSSRSARAG